MRLPQELADAIVAHIKFAQDFETMLHLLQASPSLFFSQVSKNLHHETLYLFFIYDRYTLLSAVFDTCPSIASHVYQLKIVRLNNAELHRDEALLPILLDACVNLRALHVHTIWHKEWTTQWPDQHRRALYEDMWRPTLNLTSIQLALNKISSFDDLADQTHLLETESGGAPSVTSLVCDAESLRVVCSLYGALHAYPFGHLSELRVTWNDPQRWPLRSSRRLDELLRANPRLACLEISTEFGQLPTQDISPMETLHDLTIGFAKTMPYGPAGVPEILDSLPAPSLGRFTALKAVDMRVACPLYDYELDKLEGAGETIKHGMGRLLENTQAREYIGISAVCDVMCLHQIQTRMGTQNS
ncbi:hypothetical protein GGF50DRAFT_91818 [Schizophyllum commune]